MEDLRKIQIGGFEILVTKSDDGVVEAKVTSFELGGEINGLFKMLGYDTTDTMLCIHRYQMLATIVTNDKGVIDTIHLVTTGWYDGHYSDGFQRAWWRSLDMGRCDWGYVFEDGELLGFVRF